MKMVEDEIGLYEFGVQMGMQEKSSKGKHSTVLDAVVFQNGYKIAIETKMEDWFYTSQIEGHLSAFDENDKSSYKILLCLSNKNDCLIEDDIKAIVCKCNEDKKYTGIGKVIFIHISFERFIEMMDDVLTDRDYEFKDILEDYREYCNECGLIDNTYEKLKVFTAGTTLLDNKKYGLYYKQAKNNKSKINYIGLYKDKSVRMIGKLVKIITAYMPNHTDLILEDGDILSSTEKETLIEVIRNAEKDYGYDLFAIKHQYYYTDKFIECDFKKKASGALWGEKIFYLESQYDINNIKEKSIEVIASELSAKEW